MILPGLDRLDSLDLALAVVDGSSTIIYLTPPLRTLIGFADGDPDEGTLDKIFKPDSAVRIRPGSGVAPG